MTDSEDYVVDLDEAAVKELESIYGAKAYPAEAAPAKTQAKAAPKAADPSPTKTNDNDLLRRLREAEERVSHERTRRIDAERLAHDRGTTASIASARAAESDFYAVSNALNKATSDVDSLKQMHQSALESGDYAKATDAADKMAEARATIAQLKDGKSALEDRVRTEKAKAEVASKSEPPKAEAHTDPLESFLAQFGPREREWFREHPEATPVGDQEKWFKALSADAAIRKSGVKAGSEEYYDKLDQAMGFKVDDTDTPAKADTKTVEDDVVVDTRASTVAKPAPTPRVAAPVSRDGGMVVTQRADGKLQVRLTSAQKEVAEAMGMTPSAYAKQLIKAEQQGLLGRS